MISAVKQGMYWLRKSAEQDNVNAQLFLAGRYARGADVDGNYTEAAAWYARAARLGSAEAQFNLATLFHRGLGVKPSADAAKHWYAAAARRGHPGAQHYLAEVSANAPRDVAASR